MAIAIDSEEGRFKRGLEFINEQCLAYLNEVKNCTEGYKFRQQDFHQQKAALEQIKRF